MKRHLTTGWQAIRRTPLAALLVAAAGAWGAWQALRQGGEPAIAFTLLLLVLLAGMDGLRQLAEAVCRPSRLGWFWLAAALALMGVGQAVRSEGLMNGALVLLLLGCGVFYCGGPVVRNLGLSLVTALLLLPFQESIMLLLSYPLRLLSSAWTGGILSLFRPDVKWHLTSIFIGPDELAITDACSGITELWALLLLAYFLLRGKLRPGSIGWLALLVIFPVAIVANTIRLLLTVVLLSVWGEAVFGEVMHQLLGIFFLLLSLGMLWGVLGLWPAPTERGRS